MFYVYTKVGDDYWEGDSEHLEMRNALVRKDSILLLMKDPEWKVAVVDDDYGYEVGDVYTWKPKSGISCKRGVDLFEELE